jgi:CPA2 family monovalent cation:H+ antiporter-2
MELFPLIRDLALILGVAAVFALIFQRIGQPLVLGYLLAGLIIGPYTPSTPMIVDIPSIKMWAELGVIFLMFNLGLEFSFNKLSRVGLTAGFTAGFEAIAMIFLGYWTGKLQGWSFKDSLFLGAMLSISSTTIIIKTLDELKLKRRRFSELIFGILIVEDLLAILILVGLSTFVSTELFSWTTLVYSAAKLIFVIGTWFLGGYTVLPRLVRYVGKVGSDETLMILSVGLCLFLVVIASKFHYSAALGSFIMGSILAESSESHRIEELLRPLKDLFAAVFFVSVGMLLNPAVIFNHFWTILCIALVTIGGKIISSTLGALITGQTLRTAIQVGFGLAQIGEFSFIIAGLGLSLGVTSDFIYPIGVAVSLITTFTTPYLIRSSHSVAVVIENSLPTSVQTVLNGYVAWQQERRADLALMHVFYNRALSWGLNGILITALFLLVGEFVTPWVEKSIQGDLLISLISWGISILLSAPFIWAMSVAFVRPLPSNIAPSETSELNQTKRDFIPKGVALFVGRLLTLIWVGILSLEFFSIGFTILLLLFLSVLLFIIQASQLEASYEWFETQFLSAFEAGGKTSKSVDLQSAFAPWDAHLIRIKVNPNSDFVLKPLANTQLKAQFGLNVVAIQRGMQLMVSPNRQELVLPGDELLVLGTDDQVEKVRKKIENPSRNLDASKHISNYQLRHLKLEVGSSLIGKMIKTSGIREDFESVIVGVEHQGQRILNPAADWLLSQGDLIWVVGKADQVEALSRIVQSPT